MKPQIRKAQPSDEPAIRALLAELDLVRPELALQGFWVAEARGRVAGIAHVEAVGEAIFLSSIGVSSELQGSGIGSALVSELLARERRQAWLYTVIPGFFSRLGFVPAEAAPELPPRSFFGCDACEPGKCVCMTRPCDAA